MEAELANECSAAALALTAREVATVTDRSFCSAVQAPLARLIRDKSPILRFFTTWILLLRLMVLPPPIAALLTSQVQLVEVIRHALHCRQ